MPGQSVETAVAALEVQVKSIQDGITKLESLMTRVLTVSENVAILQQKQGQTDITVERAFRAIEHNLQALNEFRGAVEAKFTLEIDKAKTVHDEHEKATLSLEKRVDGFENYAKGFIKAILIAWTLFGAAGLGVFGWAVREAIELRDEVNTLRGRVEAYKEIPIVVPKEEKSKP